MWKQLTLTLFFALVTRETEYIYLPGIIREYHKTPLNIIWERVDLNKKLRKIRKFNSEITDLELFKVNVK